MTTTTWSPQHQHQILEATTDAYLSPLFHEKVLLWHFPYVRTSTKSYLVCKCMYVCMFVCMYVCECERSKKINLVLREPEKRKIEMYSIQFRVSRSRKSFLNNFSRHLRNAYLLHRPTRMWQDNTCKTLCS